MIWGAATKIASKLADSGDCKKLDQDNVIKRTLGLADTGIPIGREDEPAGYVRWDAQDNDVSNSGKSASADGEVKWREFLWTGARRPDARWSD